MYLPTYLPTIYLSIYLLTPLLSAVQIRHLLKCHVLVFLTVDNAIHRINYYPAYSVISVIDCFHCHAIKN